MKKIIIEVGSTVTKVDLFDGNTLERIKNITIEFKKNYTELKKIKEEDINTLIENINKIKEITSDIFVCGTSIFRNLTEIELDNFLEKFYSKTNLNFHVISPEQENELTVKGVTRLTNKKLGVIIGGGGSTEIAICDNQQIIESTNIPIGVIDVMQKFPDLANDIATSSLDEVIEYIESKINLPKKQVDVLVLAGGAHKYFAEEAKFNSEPNILYSDTNAPIMMDINTRIQDTLNYYEKVSLDEIRNRVEDPNWWYATRAMCAFVLVVAKKLEAKYIIPTDIAMSYGLIESK